MKFLDSTRLALGALALAGLVLTGCLNDDADGPAQVVVKMGVKDMNKSGSTGLGKSSTIRLKKLIITITSNGEGDPVIRDTILSDTGAFVSNATIDQSFSRKFEIKPLRNWTVVVKTLDALDSVVHRDSVVAQKILAGETRNVTMNLSSRFVMYEVKFALPDSIKSSEGNMAQKILIHRFVLKVDSLVAIDTTVPGAFAPSPVQHSITFDYIKSGTTPDVRLQYFGRAEGNPEDTLLFEKFMPKVKPDSSYPTQTATYVGPGSDGTGGARSHLMLNIGRVRTVRLDVGVEPLIPNF